MSIAGLRQQVDPHWQRGIATSRLRWLHGVRCPQGRRQLLRPIAYSQKTHKRKFCLESGLNEDFYDQIWFTRLTTASLDLPFIDYCR